MSYVLHESEGPGSGDMRPVGDDVAVARGVRKKTKSKWSIAVSTIELRKAQKTDQDLKTLIDWLELGERPS